jgi:GT2 family glycosyltransferase
MAKKVIVIIPNWNGAKELSSAIDSVLAQSYHSFELVIVDNGSVDESKSIIESYKSKDPRVRSIYLDKNYGYTGGINPGFQLAIKEGAPYAAPFNNDARADTDWLLHLVGFLGKSPQYGIATCSLLMGDGKTIDSTADFYTIWGVSYPRGRDEPARGQYDNDTEIFGASGGASLYRVAMLKEIGLFDEDFFAYYEDIDLSFRAQLSGWKAAFVPQAVVYHDQGTTSRRIANRKADDHSVTPFITMQYMKNLPFIIVKDVPAALLPRIVPRFFLIYSLSFIKALLTRRGVGAIKGNALFWMKLPKKLRQRRSIQKNRKLTNAQLWNILIHDLPPNAYQLKKLRGVWWKLTFRSRS